MTDQSSPLGAGMEATLIRTFDAPRALVFDCFTDPIHLARWWGPLGCQNEIKVLEVRPGGEISLHMAGPGYSHTMGGEYVEIDRPNRLVFLSKAFEAPDGGWGIVNRNTLTFEDKDGATRLTLHVRVERAEGDLVLGALNGMKTGWGQSLERLGDLVGGGGKMDQAIGDRVIILTRAFDVTPERLWRALTEPDAFVQWWCAGGGVIETMDVRPGGKWSVVQTAADGSSHRFWGEYKAVGPPVLLAMTQGFDGHGVIDVVHELTAEWGRTTLKRTMTFPDNHYRDGMWNSGLERGAAVSYDHLAAMLARG